jgi:hypothetical protein
MEAAKAPEKVEDKKEDKKEEKKEEKKQREGYFEPISILQLINAAQNQNGLRHKDYKRYQSYCSRKIHKYEGTWRV